VWPLEPSRREYLRIGAHAVERWAGTPSRLECLASHALPASSSAQSRAASGAHLEAALQSLYVDKPKSTVTLLMESAVMPAQLVEVGADAWAPSQVLMLLRHRLNALYGEAGMTLDAWDARIDYKAGEPFALGYGLPTSLKLGLIKACQSAGIECVGLLPALAWGLSRLKPGRRWPERRGWLAWAEQDRALLARFDAGRAVSLNAAATLTDASSKLVRQIEIEQVRCGTSGSGPIIATRWDAGHASIASELNSHDTTHRPVTWIDIGTADVLDATGTRQTARAAVGRR